MILETKVNGLVGLLDGAVHEADMDVIHDFRVGIKKIKAIIELVKYNYPDFEYNALPKCLNKIYKRLGVIRNYQILQQQLIYKFHHHPNIVSLIAVIQNKIFDLKHFSQKFYSRKFIGKQLKKIPFHLPGFIDFYEVQLFLQYELGVIIQLICSPVKNAERLHEVRKRIKIVSNVLKMLFESNTAPNTYIEKNSRIAETISKMLGEMEDLIIVDQLLTKKLMAKINKAFRIELLNWKKEVIQFHEENVEKLYGMLNTNFSQLI